MILVDFHQTIIAAIMVDIYGQDEFVLNEEIVRKKIIMTLAKYKRRLKTYGRMILCCDSKNSWRKQEFPYYKAKRRIQQMESSFNWEEINLYINAIKKELKELSPFPVVEAEGAEADDIIYHLADAFHTPNAYKLEEPIVVVSKDKDLLQVLAFDNVDLFNPSLDSFVSLSKADIRNYLMEHIARGDNTDGIPNIFSPDNQFIIGNKRQTAITQKKLDAWKDGSADIKEEPFYERNKKLIDISETPLDVIARIHEAFGEQSGKKIRLKTYFINNGLGSMIEKIQDFA